MSPAPAVERRKHARHPLPTGVRFYHEPSHREYLGRCADISRGGLLMFVPPTSPIRPGDSIRLTLSGVPRPEFADLGGRAFDASVVRVERRQLTRTGQVAVGARFLGA